MNFVAADFLEMADSPETRAGVMRVLRSRWVQRWPASDDPVVSVSRSCAIKKNERGLILITLELRAA